MPDVILPPLPPLPPPVGSSVRPSVSAGTPPPPTAPPPSPIRSPATEATDDRYAPPAWLDKQRGNGRTSALNAKFVILGIVGIFAAFFAAVIILMILAGTTESRFVEIPLDDLEQPTFPDENVFVDSMADPSHPVMTRTAGPA